MERATPTVLVYVAIRARDPHGVLVVEGPEGRSLPHCVYDGSGSLAEAAAGVLAGLGPSRRRPLTFMQCVTVGRPSIVAFLFGAYLEARPVFAHAGCAWIEPDRPSGPMDGLSAHFAVRATRPYDKPYVDLGMSVPGVCLADAG